MAKFIKTISCESEPSHGKQTVYVLQTGTWDLRYFPPRFAIRDKRSLPAVALAIGELFKNISCIRSIRIVWVQTVAHPTYESGRVGGTYNIHRWRNNHAIAAINQYIRKALQALDLENNVKILETFDIIMPRAAWSEARCKDHYLCHDAPSPASPLTIKTTPAGYAILNSILQLSCESELAEADYYTSGVAVAVPFSAGLHDSTASVLFLVQHGLRRAVPDLFTLQALNYSISEVRIVDEDGLADIPLGGALPSRRDGVLYRCIDTDAPAVPVVAAGLMATATAFCNPRAVYVMSRGQRRPFASAQVFRRMGHDFEKVVAISAEELEKIPEGLPVS